jgi:hypothetical protein
MSIILDPSAIADEIAWKHKKHLQYQRADLATRALLRGLRALSITAIVAYITVKFVLGY